jgi:hypothetical protein
VDTEEVDLDHWDDPLMNRNFCWDGSDETDELVVVRGAHTHMPFPKIARRLEGPLQELFRVIKSKREQMSQGKHSGGRNKEREREAYRNILSSSST